MSKDSSEYKKTKFFCCWLWGWLVLQAWQLCMLVINHVGSPLPQMCKTNRFASLCLVWLIQFLTDLVTKWCKIKCYFPGNVSMGAWGFCKSPLCKHVFSLSPVSTTPGTHECGYHGRLTPVFWQFRWVLFCHPLKTTTTVPRSLWLYRQTSECTWQNMLTILLSVSKCFARNRLIGKSRVTG